MRRLSAAGIAATKVPIWILVFGISLELGAWCLELSRVKPFHARYCSSVTFSIHSTALPSSAS